MEHTTNHTFLEPAVTDKIRKYFNSVINEILYQLFKN